MAKQVIRIIRPKHHKPKGIAINKHSIGTVWINGVPQVYNADKVLTNRLDFDDAVDGVDTKEKKKKIRVRRKR